MFCFKNFEIFIKNEWKYIHFYKFKVKDIDTIASGDLFTDAMVLVLSKGEDLKAAIHFANKVASLVVQKEGTQSSWALLLILRGHPHW